MARALVSCWYGTFLLDGATVVTARRAPLAPEALAARIATRLAGGVTPEEEALLALRGGETWSTRDRRLAERGLRFDPGAPAGTPEAEPLPDDALHRAAVVRAAESSLAAAWDPSVHVEEAVRAAADLDRVRNLVGERLTSWVGRDAPEIDAGDAAAAARHALADATDSPYAPTDARVRAARRRLAELFRSIEATQADLAAAVEAAVPDRTPNLSALLGPELAARLLAQARGLDRLARLPASTVQVLGAERAFFEHLRGHAPPPRHGLLFLHPALQSAPRRERGKLARALAGKVAIAARMDRAGRPVDATLGAAFEARRRALSAARARGRPRSRKPLHAASGDG